MDYVLFGMGYGATLMLLGWALRTFGPERKYKDTNPEDIDRVVERQRWVRFIQGLGGVIAIAGTAMVLFTFIIMLVNPDDDTGRFIALVIWGFLGISVLIWCWFYVSAYGLGGIWSREAGYGFRGVPTRDSSEMSLEGVSTARVVPAPRVRDRDEDSSIGAEITEPDEARPEESAEEVTADESEEGMIGPKLDESEATEEDSGNPEAVTPATDPEYDFGDSADTTVPSEIGGRSEAIRRIRERRALSKDSSNNNS